MSCDYSVEDASTAFDGDSFDYSIEAEASSDEDSNYIEFICNNPSTNLKGLPKF